MGKSIFLAAIFAGFVGSPAISQQQHIPRAQLEEMFAGIQTQTTWNINGEMLWGYFFTSRGKSELEKIATALKRDGYRLVGIREREPKAPQAAAEWQLHVERVERHTVNTLYTRNSAFESLAKDHKDVTYDGMDVGPAK
ncbi:ribonuclease E inhibitor RraB [Neorhizobium galegae]|uniref:ribonuclease E inhibitor RraB n=1 Tax=Neorhizobium galegae TaxID=399 RepID=UPI002103700A|nr:ribonuclease E inhibitor RraB [Neorhizobium galegae]MCQ1799132.1 ribonuclease E inhibitor RraB [Neorhizobium galegae]